MNDDNNIILNDDLFNEIDQGIYSYIDIFECLENGGILKINTTQTIQPTTAITIKNKLQIDSILDNDQKAIFNCPSDNMSLFTIE